jgi:DNA-directed RNA polymerase subunit N (RpoN/RPB10)
MIIPVRCFSCGKVSVHPTNRPISTRDQDTNNLPRKQVVGDLWTRYIKLIELPADGSEGMGEGYVISSHKTKISQ